MSDFHATWLISRGRFGDAVTFLSQGQLTWKLHDEALSIGQMALHLAGVEISFATQLLGEEPQGFEARLKAAATDGVVNDNPFPFSDDEMTPELVEQALEAARTRVEPILASPDTYRDIQIKSALGPTIDGAGACARLAFHPGYHQGQAHLVRAAPGFPRD
jgi:hypothetical protein